MPITVVNSLNPLFTKFATLPPTTAEDGEVDYCLDSASNSAQDGYGLLEHLSSLGAKMGYGIGYAGTPQALAGNISYEGPDVPMHTPFAGIPWGQAVLCKATKSTGKVVLEKLDGTTFATTTGSKIQGTCYGTTIKDSSIQLNCGISVAQLSGEINVPNPTDGSVNEFLVIAVFANASKDGSGVWEIGTGSTLVAVSEAIDPTVFALGTDNDAVSFTIPAAVGGFTFTARGTLARAPFVAHVPTYTSFNDKVTSFPTSQAILAAKV